MGTVKAVDFLGAITNGIMDLSLGFEGCGLHNLYSMFHFSGKISICHRRGSWTSVIVIKPRKLDVAITHGFMREARF